MSLVYEILKQLATTTLSYKGACANLLGVPVFNQYSRSSISGSLAYLTKKGFIADDSGMMCITKQGKEYIKRKQESFKTFDFKFKKDAPKNLLVIFDVPETKKAHREWLRWHLKKFNYKMIQKSVWVGPSPLPADFLKYLDTLGIRDGFKSFRLAKEYIFEKQK